MNIPASLLSENYKSMQEHDDRMILNENNTSIIQAWEIIPLKLCSQNPKADFFWVQIGLWISKYMATQSNLGYLCKTLQHSEDQHQPAQHQVPAEARWEKRRDADASPWALALGRAVPPARRGPAAQCYTRQRAARSHTLHGAWDTDPLRVRAWNLGWRGGPRTACQDTDCCAGPWGHTSNVHMHWQMFMLVILI